MKKIEPMQKKSKPLEEPIPDENSFVIKDEVPPEQMIAETDAGEETESKIEKEGAEETSGDTEAIAQQTETNGATDECPADA